MKRATMTAPVFVANINAELYKDNSFYSYTTLRNTSLKNIKDNLIERTFNDYPPLLPEDDMYSLRNRYLDILRNISSADISQDDNFDIIGNSDVKEKMNVLVREIASVAAAELLGYEHKIRNILYIFLQVMPEDYAPLLKGKGYELVSSFVGTTIMHIQNMAHAYTEQYDVQNRAASHFINQNLSLLIKEGMLTPNRQPVLRDLAADLKLAANFPIERPRETKIAAASAIGLGVGIGLFFAVKAVTSGSSGPSGPGLSL